MSPARNLRSRFLRQLTLGGAALMLAGCSHYHLGTGSAALGFQSIYVAPVSNPAAVPQAIAPVTHSLRTSLMNSGNVTLASSPETADVILEISLTTFDRKFTAVQPTDTALARKFELSLTANCTLTDRRTGQVLFSDRSIASTRQIFVDGGQGPAEYQALPLLAEQLADRVAHAVLDVW